MEKLYSRMHAILPSLILGIIFAMKAGAADPWYTTYDFAAKGVLAYWPLDGNTFDYGPNNLDGTAYNSDPAVGKLGLGYMFNGVMDATVSRIELPQYPESSALSIGAWVYLDSYTTNSDRSTIFTRRAHYADQDLHVTADGRVDFRNLRGTFELRNEVASNVVLSLNEWHYIMGTMDASWTRVYIDGVLAGEAPSTGPIDWSGSYIGSHIGVHNSDADWKPWDGRIDEVVVFGRVLSAQEIASLSRDENGNGISDYWDTQLPPNKPQNLTPAQSMTGVSLTPTLGATSFSDPNSGDTHAASQWQVRAAGAAANYSTTVYDSGPVGPMTSQSVPAGRLTAGAQYYWRVRYQDNHDTWSAWSAETRFTVATSSTPATPTGLTALSGATSIALKWNPNTEADIQGYQIYRDTSATGTFTTALAGGAVQIGTAFEDTTVAAGARYYYKITAVNTGGAQSAKSAAASATVGAIVVTMTDTRSEPGTTVSLPINCAYATGITGNGMDIQIIYNPMLLTPQRVHKTVLTQEFNFYDNVEVANGQVNISGISAAGATIRGEGRLLEVDFKVAPTAVTGSTALHSFVKVKMYDITAQALSVDYSDMATFTVGGFYRRGDVNGDGDIDSADALLAQQAAVGLTTLSAQAREAADVSGDDEVDSADVTLILRLAVGLPVNPPAGSKLGFKPKDGVAHAAANLTVWVPNMSARSGTDVIIPVYASDLSGVAGSKLQINYDPAVLQFKSMAAGPAVLQATLSYRALAKAVVVSFSSSKAMASGQGTLVNLTFKVVGAYGRKTYLTPASCKLNGMYGENLAWNSAITMTRGLCTVTSVNGTEMDWLAYP